jgi:hypothetical protein
MYALQTDLFISRFNSYAHNRTWLLLLLRRYIWTIYTWDPERFKAQEGGYRDHEHHRAPLLFSKHILRLWRNNRIPIQISPEFFIWILFLNLVFLTLQFQPTCNYKEIRYCFSCTFFHLLILLLSVCNDSFCRSLSHGKPRTSFECVNAGLKCPKKEFGGGDGGWTLLIHQ